MSHLPEVINTELLPRVLQDFVRLIGLSATMDFVHAYGGLRIYVPAPERAHADHPYAQVIGLDNLRRLAQVYGQEDHFPLPKAEPPYWPSETAVSPTPTATTKPPATWPLNTASSSASLSESWPPQASARLWIEGRRRCFKGGSSGFKTHPFTDKFPQDPVQLQIVDRRLNLLI